MKTFSPGQRVKVLIQSLSREHMFEGVIIETDKSQHPEPGVVCVHFTDECVTQRWRCNDPRRDRGYLVFDPQYSAWSPKHIQSFILKTSLIKE